MENQPTMPQDPTASPKTASRRGLTRDAVVASICGFVVVLMLGAAYAAVPFYNWFCRATGFNGTTQVATSAPSGAPLTRKIASLVGIAEIVLLERKHGAWVPLAAGDLSLDAIARAEAWLTVPGGAEGYAAGTAVDGYMLRE